MNEVLTKLQLGLIVVGSAVLFQVAGSLQTLSTDDLTDWKGWLVGVGIGVLNSVGVAVVALKTAGGLSKSP
jgi:hypothetical protein